jgi:hypothetical protein
LAVIVLDHELEAHATLQAARPSWPYIRGFSWENLNAPQNHQLVTGESRETALRLCWTLLRLAVGKLAVRLSVAPGEPTNEPHYAEVESFCAMLGFDLAALRAEAANAIPYAKLWREEVIDDWAAQVQPESASA